MSKARPIARKHNIESSPALADWVGTNAIRSPADGRLMAIRMISRTFQANLGDWIVKWIDGSFSSEYELPMVCSKCGETVWPEEQQDG